MTFMSLRGLLLWVRVQAVVILSGAFSISFLHFKHSRCFFYFFSTTLCNEDIIFAA